MVFSSPTSAPTQAVFSLEPVCVFRDIRQVVMLVDSVRMRIRTRLRERRPPDSRTSAALFHCGHPIIDLTVPTDHCFWSLHFQCCGDSPDKSVLSHSPKHTVELPASTFPKSKGLSTFYLSALIKLPYMQV